MKGNAKAEVIRSKVVNYPEETHYLPLEEVQAANRELTALECLKQAIPILQALKHYGEVPTSVLVKTFHNAHINSGAGSGVLGRLEREGYITRRFETVRGHRTHLHRITLKGKAAIKVCK
jgi:DNA-binding MarR family transcriptional regulator